MKNKILSILFIILVFGFMLLSFVIPDINISKSERRNLAKFPKIELETVINGEFFEDLNTYFVEQFPFRDVFKNIKGIFSSNIFQKNDENGIFIEDNAIYQLDSSLDEKSINHFTNLLNKIQDNYLKTNNVYYTVIPDKNYYLDNSIPKINYEKLECLLSNDLKNMQYINLFDTLNLNSYYKTDIHWKQEDLSKTVEKIEYAMNLQNYKLSNNEHEYSNFYGALYGRVANNLKPDKITYLSNDIINNAKVYDYEKKNYRKVYEITDLQNVDSYDIYLGGAKSLLIIENERQNNGKELILFRDSYGSSIAPLLIPNYSKITLIDLRYINSDLLERIDKIEFSEEQDVLFMYSTPIINSSFTLK